MTRKEAIELLRELSNFVATPPETDEALNMAIEALEHDKKEIINMKSVFNLSDDLISRQAAIDAVMGFMPSLTTPDGCGQFDREIFEAQEMFVDIGQALNKLPSAQPFTAEQIQTMQELESAQVEKAYELGKADRPKWIPVTWHEITEEERAENGYPKDWVVFMDCEMPSDEQEILVTTRYGTVEKDMCYEDGELSLDSGYDWIDDILAWMPLPEAYREDGEEE